MSPRHHLTIPTPPRPCHHHKGAFGSHHRHRGAFGYGFISQGAFEVSRKTTKVRLVDIEIHKGAFGSGSQPSANRSTTSIQQHYCPGVLGGDTGNGSTYSLHYCPGVLGGDTGNGSTYSLNKCPGVLGGDTCDGYIQVYVTAS
ncbi:hypothetical protein Tco_0369659 [Tanacetum coccineum]